MKIIKKKEVVSHQRKFLYNYLIILVLIDIFDKQIEKIKNMKKIYLGILGLSIISILSAFSISNNEYKKADDRCGCLKVNKKSISQNNQTVESWYEKVCGSKCGTCAYGYNDKWNAKNQLQTKYDKMYSGTDFKVTLDFVSDDICE
jgi:hypothetical protein